MKRPDISRGTYVYVLAVVDALVLVTFVFTSIANFSGSQVVLSPWVFVFGVGMLIFLIFATTGKDQ